MGGSAVNDDWEFTKHEARTLVLLGRTGNGKSATGNSIIVKKEFTSKYSSSGVTSTCQLESAQLDDGLTINVIDNPGLFDFSGEPEVIGKEIIKCMDLAKDGIHAFLLVLSVRTWFSREEQAAVQSFQEFFGNRISDYMIVVFTGGDELEDSDETLDGYLGNDCPEETLKLCDNRKVLFDNKTKDPKKKDCQFKELLSLVNLVLEKNDGVPYTNELFKALQAMKVSSLFGDAEHEKTQATEPIPKYYEEKLTEKIKAAATISRLFRTAN
ncbi:PREDICTED: immune-associated nucleotide-binding protein 9-like [Nicotiana attenuata]|uniref:immune-associated nucleotide-binding protein 9-like n=1 Tax=Nicotiana attenuata TaxID=49451 RepID=UPI0009047645|nr:PREDICTED: immune-associated nucleotide-binding protein 9-like [Nicotiana attenuata]